MTWGPEAKASILRHRHSLSPTPPSVLVNLCFLIFTSSVSSLFCVIMSYPGQRYYGNHQHHYTPPQGPPQYPPSGHGQYYQPPPPPVLSRANLDYRPPPGPPPNAYNNSYHPGPYGPPPPPPQIAQSFNHQIGGQYTFQYSQCTGKRKVRILNCVQRMLIVGPIDWNQLFWHLE